MRIGCMCVFKELWLHRGDILGEKLSVDIFGIRVAFSPPLLYGDVVAAFKLASYWVEMKMCDGKCATENVRNEKGTV
jgi:hypothetical protein